MISSGHGIHSNPSLVALILKLKHTQLGRLYCRLELKANSSALHFLCAWTEEFLTLPLGRLMAVVLVLGNGACTGHAFGYLILMCCSVLYRILGLITFM